MLSKDFVLKVNHISLGCHLYILGCKDVWLIFHGLCFSWYQFLDIFFGFQHLNMYIYAIITISWYYYAMNSLQASAQLESWTQGWSSLAKNCYLNLLLGTSSIFPFSLNLSPGLNLGYPWYSQINSVFNLMWFQERSKIAQELRGEKCKEFLCSIIIVSPVCHSPGKQR